MQNPFSYSSLNLFQNGVRKPPLAAAEQIRPKQKHESPDTLPPLTAGQLNSEHPPRWPWWLPSNRLIDIPELVRTSHAEVRDHLASLVPRYKRRSSGTLL